MPVVTVFDSGKDSIFFLRKAKKVGSFRLFMNCLNDPIPNTYIRTFVIKCCKISFSFLSYTYVWKVIEMLQKDK